jgi:phosphate transport system permease protein
MSDLRAFRRSRNFFASLKIASMVALGVSLVALVSIVLFVLIRGTGNLTFQLLFGKYGASPSIWPAFLGTLELIVIAVGVAAPIGIASAIFLSEYAERDFWLIRCIRLATETLAGIPSIVYGLFGYLVFVVACGWGYSLLGGGLTLAIMILPLIVRSTEESLLSVPMAIREGSYALGAGKVRTIFAVVLPSASEGILTSLILAMGRVVSESAVLIMTVGMVVNIVPVSPLSAGTSLALDIYYFASFGYPEEASATAVVLLLFVLSLNLLAFLLARLFERKKGLHGQS